MRKDVLEDPGIQEFIYSSNIRGKDLLSSLEFYELRD